MRFFTRFTFLNDDDGIIPFFSHCTMLLSSVLFCFVVVFSLLANVTAAPRTTACFGTDATGGAVCVFLLLLLLLRLQM